MPKIEDCYPLIGAYVRELREAEGWTREELGDATGVSRSTIGSIEDGKQRIPLHTLIAIAGAFEIPVWWFLDMVE